MPPLTIAEECEEQINALLLRMGIQTPSNNVRDRIIEYINEALAHAKRKEQETTVAIPKGLADAMDYVGACMRAGETPHFHELPVKEFIRAYDAWKPLPPAA